MRRPSEADRYLHAEVSRLKQLVHATLDDDAPEPDEIEEDPFEIVSELRSRAGQGEPAELPPLLRLARRFALSDLELDVLVATLAPHLDPEVPELYRALRGGLWSEHVDATLLQRVFASDWQEALALRRAIGSQSTLVRNGLLRLDSLPAGATALHSVLTVHPRILHFAIGEEGLDRIIAPFCAVELSPIGMDAVILPADLKQRALDVLAPGGQLDERMTTWGYDDVMPRGRGSVLLFVGPPGTGKTRLSRALAHHLDRPLLRVFVGKMMRAGVATEDVLAELEVEARLRAALLLFDDCAELFAEGGPALAALLAFLDDVDGLAILATNRTDNLSLALERRVLVRLDFPRPDRLAREQIYEVLIPPDVPVASSTDIAQLAARYDFTGGHIRNAVMVALNKAVARDSDNPCLDQELLVEAAELQLRTRLDEFAITSETRLDLSRLVLPDDTMAQVRELLAACRHYEAVIHGWRFGELLPTGKGVVAIFDGPPGTGKTLCAEILGAELGRPVSRVNIPSVVSKWVGETEQHIAEIFRRARAGRGLLLFDEADALFGKRVAAPDRASDRYANMEVNLLLQEVERYEGIVVLTTNLLTALDDALLRRILFRIHFPEPDAALRTHIWRILIPEAVVLGPEVDFAELGERFVLNGGRIKNAVLRAAFRACAEGSPRLLQSHLVAAALDESKASGSVVREGGPSDDEW